MKKFYIPYIVFCIIILTLFIINLTSVSQKENTGTKQEPIKSEEIKENKSDNTAIEEDIYTVRASGNDIFVFDKDNNVIEKLNINFSNLREYDKNQFLKGIKMDNMNDVYQLMEDFSN